LIHDLDHSGRGRWRLLLASASTHRQGGSFSTLTRAAHADTVAPVAAQWAASATDVEPKDGEIRLASEVSGKIVEVLAKTNDQVKAGDPLLRIDDRDYYVKIAAAAAEAGVRERERAEEQVTGPALDRRNAEDALFKANEDLFAAHEAFDAAYRAEKTGKGNSDAVEAARKTLASRQEAVESAEKTGRDRSRQACLYVAA
jgi:HlyD family secretion protein